MTFVFEPKLHFSARMQCLFSISSQFVKHWHAFYLMSKARFGYEKQCRFAIDFCWPRRLCFFPQVTRKSRTRNRFNFVTNSLKESFKTTRGKKIYEQLSRTWFLTWFEVHAFSLQLRSKEKRAGFSNHVKNRVLESCSYIFFPLTLGTLVFEGLCRWFVQNKV